MSEPLYLNLNEAGFVVDQPSVAINRAIDKGMIAAGLERRGKSRLRLIGGPELRYLAIAGQIGNDLTPAARRKVYDAVQRLPAGADRLDLGIVEIKLVEIDRRILARLARLAAVKSHVEPGGAEPRLKGAGISVHVIAGLARGQSVDEIVEDYPAITREQVEAAIDYAKVYPRSGRPLPERSFKRMLGDGADAGLWDLEGGVAPLRPRPMP